MKKILLSFIAAATLFACGNAPEYKITGTIEGAQDGDTVVLGYSHNGEDFTTVKKTVVKDGQFQFKGNQEGSKIYYIGYEGYGEPIYPLFFLEGGDIKIEIDREYSHVTGSPTNDLSVQIEDSLEKYAIEMLSYKERLNNDSTLTTEEFVDLEYKNYIARQKSMEFVRKTTRNNINNLAGMFLLLQYGDLFETDEYASLVESIPDELKDSSNNPLYSILSEIKDGVIGSDADGTAEEIMNSINEDEGDNPENDIE